MQIPKLSTVVSPSERAPSGRVRAGVMASAVLAVVATVILAVTVITGNVSSPAKAVTEVAPTTESNASDPVETPEVAPPAPRLVPYAGPQPEGFSLTYVPAGYGVQNANGSTLVLAAAGDATVWEDFSNKVVISLASPEFAAASSGTAITVHGLPASLSDPGEARILRYTDGGKAVVVQAWNSIGLTELDLIQFAEGLSVSADGPAPRG
jgi:hypothetical protein